MSFFFFLFSLSSPLPSSDSCRERPGWHGLSGFSGIRVAFDWRLAHGRRPRRESATPGVDVHARPLDCDIVMATEAK